MIRVTADQAKLLFGQRPSSSGRSKKQGPRIRKPKASLPENIVAKQICDFMLLHGWRAYRQHVGAYMPYGAAMVAFEQGRSPAGLLVRIGEKGMPDWRFEKPHLTGLGLARVVHIETKAPGKTPDPDQVEWMRKANATGTLAVWFDNYERFVAWYQGKFPGECQK